MNYKKSEVMKILMEHSKKMRQSIKNPSEATKAAWRWEDDRNEFILRLYEREEANEEE